MFRPATLLTLLLLLGPPAAAAQEAETVVLLHGLIRSPSSMGRMERALQEAGYRTCNIGYPSRRHRIEVLADEYVLPEIRRCVGDGKAHFVTHSMGGILVRYLADQGELPNAGRVVMLGPPNRGSEVVDAIGDGGLFELVNGPAGRQLGTDSTSVPPHLGPAPFELGVIAGTRSINWINSWVIDGPDDGKVAVERTRVDGMSDFLVVPSTHTFMMRNRGVIRQTITFLREGRFAR